MPIPSKYRTYVGAHVHLWMNTQYLNRLGPLTRANIDLALVVSTSIHPIPAAALKTTIQSGWKQSTNNKQVGRDGDGDDDVRILRYFLRWPIKG